MKEMRVIRLRRGLSCRELAEKAGCAEVSVRQYEAGIRTPSLYMLCRIATALDVGLDSLVTDEKKEVSVNG